MFSRLSGAVFRASGGIRSASRLFANSARYASTSAASAELRRSFLSRGRLGVALAATGVYGAVLGWSNSNVAECAVAPVLPPEGLPGTNFERTFIAIKPDGVQRGLIGKIIQRFEDKGLTLVAVKLVQPTQAIAEGHYDDLKTKPFFPKLTKFFSSGPIIAFVWQGKGAIATGRRLLGETDPAKSLPGTIRGDFAIDIGRNIIHGSDGADSAKHEINFWFKPQELVNWTPANNVWIYE